MIAFDLRSPVAIFFGLWGLQPTPLLERSTSSLLGVLWQRCRSERAPSAEGKTVLTAITQIDRGSVGLAARELAAGLGDTAIEAEFAHNRALAIARTTRSNQSPLTGLFGGRP